MTDKERLDALRKALAEPLGWYASALAHQAEVDEDERDDSYIYDEAIDHLSQISRGDAEAVLALLHEPPPPPPRIPDLMAALEESLAAAKAARDAERGR